MLQNSSYISNNPIRKDLQQVYGWAYQGAAITQNLVWVNTALEKQYYEFMFDRYIELGADTLFVKKSEIKNMEHFREAAKTSGYIEKSEMIDSLVYTLNVKGPFATSVKYEALGIGTYSINLSLVFPKIAIGRSNIIDDYTFEELKIYNLLYLSGFKYNDKKKAEVLIDKVAKAGVRVVIDMTNAKVDLLTSRASFLNVTTEPVSFIDKFPDISIYNKNINISSSIPKEYKDWRTFSLINLSKVYGYSFSQNQKLSCMGTGENPKIWFVGFNLPYFAVETMDRNTINILEGITGLVANSTPERKIVEIETEYSKNSIYIETKESNLFFKNSSTEKLILPIANIDSFKEYKQLDSFQNFIVMNKKSLKLNIGYPYLKEGILLSVIGFVLFILLAIYQNRRISNRLEGNSNQIIKRQVPL